MNSIRIFLITFSFLNLVQAKVTIIDFNNQFSSQRDIREMEKQASKLPSLETYGKMPNFNHYIKVIDLVMLASQEAVNCRKFINEYILKDLPDFKTVIDVGTGSGECSALTLKRFKKVTLVDPSAEALDKLNFINLTQCEELIKIHSTFQNAVINTDSHNLIVFAHVFYYIPIDEWISVIEKAYKMLSPQGTIFIVFNRGGTREKLVKDFGGKGLAFEDFVENLKMKYPQSEISISQEIIAAKSLSAMVQMCGLFLYDVGITAPSKKLESYVVNNLKTAHGFQASLDQTFIKIKKD